jgi:hypothetical protein
LLRLGLALGLLLTVVACSVGRSPPAQASTCHFSRHPTESAGLQAVQIDRSKPGVAVDVRVRTGKEPIVLLLSSTQAILWHLHGAAEANIQHVILLGEASGADGLPPGIPFSHCSLGASPAPYSGEAVDTVADALALSVEAVQRRPVADAAGFDIVAQPHPNVDPDVEWERCKVDFDYGGSNISRDRLHTVEACRKLCDKIGALDTDRGRIVCVFQGRHVKAYPALPGYLGRSCRFVAADGRNVESYAAASEKECRDNTCSAGELYVSTNVRDRWASQCIYNGRIVKRYRVVPVPPSELYELPVGRPMEPLGADGKNLVPTISDPQ